MSILVLIWVFYMGKQCNLYKYCGINPGCLSFLQVLQDLE